MRLAAEVGDGGWTARGRRSSLREAHGAGSGSIPQGCISNGQDRPHEPLVHPSPPIIPGHCPTETELPTGGVNILLCRKSTYSLDRISAKRIAPGGNRPRKPVYVLVRYL